MTVKKDFKTLKKWSKIGWGGFKIRRLTFGSILLIDENPADKEKFKIKCLWIQLNFIEGLIEFMKSLIARKNDFCY